MSTFATMLEVETREDVNTPVVYLHVNRNVDHTAGKAVRLDLEAEDADVSAYLSREGAVAVARALMAAADTTEEETR